MIINEQCDEWRCCDNRMSDCNYVKHSSYVLGSVCSWSGKYNYKVSWPVVADRRSQSLCVKFPLAGEYSSWCRPSLAYSHRIWTRADSWESSESKQPAGGKRERLMVQLCLKLYKLTGHACSTTSLQLITLFIIPDCMHMMGVCACHHN